MKFIKKLAACLFILLLASETTFAAFTDIEYSWYKDSIKSLYSAGLVKGYNETTYGPDMPITRAEMLKIILWSAGTSIDTSKRERCFPDVNPTLWYSPYICTANQLGIAKGFDSWNFWPNDTVTNLEALAFGFRAFGIQIPDTGTNWYDSYQKVADTNNILATHGYLLSTKISRGKAAELIERIKEFKATKQVLDYKSAGCEVGGKLATKNTIVIDGVTRKYNLYVPSNYTKDKQYGLVVALHGRTNSNDMVQGYMGLQWGYNGGVGTRSKDGSARQSQNDYIVAYPAWLPVSGGYSWGGGSVKLFDAMIQQISSNYCVNRDQVFVVWHSLGASFANQLACVRWDVIHGVSAVAGPGFSGTCTGPAASLLFHRTDDKLVPYQSWKTAEKIHITENSCSNKTVNITIGTFACKQRTDCSTGNPVVWCEGYSTYQNDPHGWPVGWGGAILGFFSGKFK